MNRRLDRRVTAIESRREKEVAAAYARLRAHFTGRFALRRPLGSPPRAKAVAERLLRDAATLKRWHDRTGAWFVPPGVRDGTGLLWKLAIFEVGGIAALAEAMRGKPDASQR